MRFKALALALALVCPCGEARANLTVARWEVGVASWYSQGHRTANGERYNPRAMTAASRTLPFGTIVVVAAGNRLVIVRINDRGPYAGHGERIIDLSAEAGHRLGIIKLGLAQVTVKILWQRKEHIV